MTGGTRGHCVTLWLTVLGCLLTACAKIGDPLPPQTILPDTVSDLRVIQVGDRFQLMFSLPTSQVREVEIYRLCDSQLAFEEQAELLVGMAPDRLTPYRDTGQFLHQDRLEVNQSCRYGIRFVSRRGGRSPFSNLVQSQPIYPAQPPTQLTSQVQQDQISVRWKPPTENIDGSRPAHVEGYLVNSEHFVSRPEHVDLEFQFEEVQSYQMQTVSRRGEALVLSDFSETLTLVPKDTFPPSVPQGLTILSVQGRVQLAWDANDDKDLRGYFVYRGTDQNHLEKSSLLITINTYLDESTTAGRTFYYRVSATDRAGNESPQSETASVAVR